MRDYAYHEIKGGAKGEIADYLLYDNGGGNTLQFVPVTSKIKLNKRRKYSAVYENEPVNRNENSYIVLAARAYSKDEQDQFNKLLHSYGNKKYRVSDKITPFASKDELTRADKGVADLLKEMFRHHLPKVPVDDGSEEDFEDKSDKAKSEEEDAGEDVQKQDEDREMTPAEETKQEAPPAKITTAQVKQEQETIKQEK